MLRKIVMRSILCRNNLFICSAFENVGQRKQIHFSDYLRNPRHTSKSNITSPAISSKYQVITELNSPVIEHTVDETHYPDKYPLISDEYDDINLERGKHGVFDIEDLVDVLRRENSKDIFVATVPKETNYVQYIVVVSGRSKRHILALAEFVRKIFKKKRDESDRIPKIEGKGSDEWVALDLGNIALHIFSAKARVKYDLETLWAVGPEYDELSNSKGIDTFESYSSLLKDLMPLS